MMIIKQQARQTAELKIAGEHPTKQPKKHTRGESYFANSFFARSAPF